MVYYPSDWSVYIGGNKEHFAKAKKIMKELNKREHSFISAVVNELGLTILEYWDLNPNDPEQNKRLKEILKQIDYKYIKG